MSIFKFCVASATATLMVMAATCAVADTVATTPAAATPAVESGTYFFIPIGYNSGSLIIKNGRFQIETIGPNHHLCELEGTITGQTAVAINDEGTTCRFRITGAHGALEIDRDRYESEESCREFCGFRGSFNGPYRKPPAACMNAARSQRLNLGRSQYAKKNYAAARATLTALIKQCQTFMTWVEADDARADLALTQHRLGDNSGCLTTLAQTYAINSGINDLPPVDSDDYLYNVLDNLSPADADDYRRTGKAILFNTKLCKAAAARRRG